MKKFAVTSLLLFVAVFLAAQSFGPPSLGFGGPIATSPSQCPVSAPHGFVLCPVETGPGTGAVYVSVNGSAAVQLSGLQPPPTFTATAVTLPAGSQATVSLSASNQFSFGIPTGATGTAGPQGPPGPAQSFTKANCGGFSIANASANFSNCTEQ